MNEYRQNAINHLKTHLGCVGYRDYLVAELEKLEQIEQILDRTKEINGYPLNEIREVIENG